MKQFLVFIITAFSLIGQAQKQIPNSSVPDMAKKAFLKFAEDIKTDVIRELPTQNNGRIKPFDTLARETALFVSGSRSPVGVDPVRFYLALITYEGSGALEFIEIRNKDVREQLGFPRSMRHYSIQELEQAGLETRARPLLPKFEENKKLLSAVEKDLVEAFHQYYVAKQVQSGEHFFNAIDFSNLNGGAHGDAVEVGKNYLRSVARQDGMSEPLAQELITVVSKQPVPPLFSGFQSRVPLEVKYNHAHPFLVSGILYFALGMILIFGLLKPKNRFWLVAAFAIPLVIHVAGFGIRVFITGFAPVTSMYGTMLWVAFGVALFSIMLLILYKNEALVGLLIIGSSLVLLLTESFPLILSPDMDPIVAVLRSNYWLTLHVLTVTISYAAFTICMLIGNYALIRSAMGTANEKFLSTYAHYAYRMAQLGVCLITAGIILGGIWADYSWGRFWGWDPKETWALIADMGFLIILHSRYNGWLRSFGTLAAMPLAYLLVIMAWYGVNFILAAGLHSYGFSSGGATAVGVFVALQLGLLGYSLYRRQQIA